MFILFAKYSQYEKTFLLLIFDIDLLLGLAVVNETRKGCSAFIVRTAKCLRFYELWMSHLQNCSYYSRGKCDPVTCRAATLKLRIETQEAARCLILSPGLACSLNLLHSPRVGNGGEMAFWVSLAFATGMVWLTASHFMALYLFRSWDLLQSQTTLGFLHCP